MTSEKPNPELIFDALNAYQKSATLSGAIELDLFTGVGEGKNTVSQLAEYCKATAKGIRVLCDFMVIQGFLGKDDGHYLLTPISAAFLDRKSPSYLGSIVRFLKQPSIEGAFQDVASLVRKGGTLLPGQGTVEANNPIWVEFARSMAPLALPMAEAVAKLVEPKAGKPLKVLDIAAGHGYYGISIGKRNPQAQIVALDWPAVLEVAKTNASKAGMDGRFHTLPGSAFETEFAGEYEIVLLTNFLHHFDQETCKGLIGKIRKSISKGGRTLTVEFVPNEDRVSPPVAASFAMMMLGTTASGDAYTFSEYEQMFREGGFSRSELHTVPNAPQSVIVSYA